MPLFDGKPLVAGTLIRIRKAGSSDEWCLGRVVVASSSEPEQSVALELFGMVRSQAGWIGASLPVTINYHLELVESLFGEQYEIEVAALPEDG